MAPTPSAGHFLPERVLHWPQGLDWLDAAERDDPDAVDDLVDAGLHLEDSETRSAGRDTHGQADPLQQGDEGKPKEERQWKKQDLYHFNSGLKQSGTYITSKTLELQAMPQITFVKTVQKRRN